MNLIHLFDLSLRGRADQIGLEFGNRTFTFNELDVRSNRVAQHLIAEGLKPGDRLCVYLANCVEMIDVYLGCLKAGIVFVPMNILYRQREIGHILNDCEPRAILSDDRLSETIPVWSRKDLETASSRYSGVRPDVFPDGDAPAAILYTSGTTGASKGAILSHNNFAVNGLNLATCWQISAADRFLLSLPLFHAHGLGNGLHCWLISGCRMKLLERFEAGTVQEFFLSFRPTLFFGVPTMYVRLLETDAAEAREIGSFVRLFVSGSAALSAAVFERFEQLFGHKILERYGMSETLMNISNPLEGERRPGTVGLPLPGVSVKVVDGDENVVANGQTGEIRLRGSNVFQGYWKNEAATRSAFSDGFFRTGDLGIRSEDGYYTLCGRRSDLIISGGFNIYPREIEEFLEQQPEIAEAAVVGLADAARGEVPIAYVVVKGELNPSDIEERCREAMASFKVPRRFEVVERLPRNALGKIQKHLLLR